jgi:hypothetical protein
MNITNEYYNRIVYKYDAKLIQPLGSAKVEFDLYLRSGRKNHE